MLLTQKEVYKEGAKGAKFFLWGNGPISEGAGLGMDLKTVFKRECFLRLEEMGWVQCVLLVAINKNNNNSCSCLLTASYVLSPLQTPYLFFFSQRSYNRCAITYKFCAIGHDPTPRRTLMEFSKLSVTFAWKRK